MNMHQQSLLKSKEYLYARFKEINITRDYGLSAFLAQQIKAISSSKYTATAKGDIGNLLVLLKDAEIADTGYDIKGSTIWLPYGVKYKKEFVSQMSRELEGKQYEEYCFPNMISREFFKVLCDNVYDFSSQALFISGNSFQAVLKPTGESSIYPALARWIGEGKKLPIKLFQSGPFFRYKSSPHSYLRPFESSFMLEAHSAFASRDEMLSEFTDVLDVCKRWVDLLCLDTLMVSRPIEYNKPVSEQTIGFDVILPNGKTIQTAIAYLQSQIFSKPYQFAFESNGAKTTTHQITFGITERNIYTSLFVHADEFGLRLPSKLAP